MVWIQIFGKEVSVGSFYILCGIVLFAPKKARIVNVILFLT
jgi:hypothetical protein